MANADGKAIIAIGVPSAGLWKASMGNALVALTSFSAGNGVIIEIITADSCYVEMNRDNIVRMALGLPYAVDGILWVDTDMGFPPDALLRLMMHRKDIIGANYRTRVHPYTYTGFFLDNDDRHAAESGLHEMQHIATGLCLVRAEVYRNLPQPWYKAPVNSGDARDEVYFCHRAREAGYKVWCDMDLTRQVVHVGDQAVGWFAPEQLIQKEGARLQKADQGFAQAAE